MLCSELPQLSPSRHICHCLWEMSHTGLVWVGPQASVPPRCFIKYNLLTFIVTGIWKYVSVGRDTKSCSSLQPGVGSKRSHTESVNVGLGLHISRNEPSMSPEPDRMANSMDYVIYIMMSLGCVDR